MIEIKSIYTEVDTSIIINGMEDEEKVADFINAQKKEYGDFWLDHFEISFGDLFQDELPETLSSPEPWEYCAAAAHPDVGEDYFMAWVTHRGKLGDALWIERAMCGTYFSFEDYGESEVQSEAGLGLVDRGEIDDFEKFGRISMIAHRDEYVYIDGRGREIDPETASPHIEFFQFVKIPGHAERPTMSERMKP